jgi:hypothetical protein
MRNADPDLDDVIEIREVGPELLRTLANRIAQSSTWEHMVYRENEIDQVWRLIDRPRPLTDLPPETLKRLQANIMAIHDLVGVDHRPAEAAALLEQVLSGAD